MLALTVDSALADQVDAGDTAWIMASTALVLFMTLPGLALFYGGLVRVRNVLSVLMQCFSIAGVATIVWLVCGYSLAFGEGNAWIGDFSHVLFAGIGEDTVSGSIQHTLNRILKRPVTSQWTLGWNVVLHMVSVLFSAKHRIRVNSCGLSSAYKCC